MIIMKKISYENLDKIENNILILNQQLSLILETEINKIIQKGGSQKPLVENTNKNINNLKQENLQEQLDLINTKIESETDKLNENLEFLELELVKYRKDKIKLIEDKKDYLDKIEAINKRVDKQKEYKKIIDDEIKNLISDGYNILDNNFLQILISKLKEKNLY